MAARSLHLYIAHAHHALNAASASAFQNIIVWFQQRGEPLTGLKRAHFRFIHLIIFVALFAIGPRPVFAARKHSNRPARVQTGLDVLEAEKFAPLRGKHVGLITNHTGLDSQGRSTVDVLSHAAGFQVIALFSPEHGLAGRNDEKVSSTKDPSTGLPVYSLYGDTPD